MLYFKHLLIITMVLSSLAIASCNKGKGNDDDGLVNNEIDLDHQDPPSPVANYSITPIDTTFEIDDCLPMLCPTFEVDWSITSTQAPTYYAQIETIWPAGFVYLNSIDKATPNRCDLRHGSGVLIMGLNNGSNNTLEMEEVTYANVTDAINNLIEANNGIIAANWGFEYHRFKEASELGIHTKANFNFLGSIGLDIEFGFESEDNLNRVIVTFNQNIYTIVYQRPSENRSAIFHSSVTGEDYNSVAGSDNPLGYISSVSYGKKFYLLIESSSSFENIEAAINGDFLGIVSGGGDFNSINSLSNLSIRAAALGGVPETTMNAVTSSSNLSNLVGFMHDENDFYSAVPISYQIRSVATDEVVKNGIATNYTLTECTPAGNSIECENGGIVELDNCECNCECPYTGTMCNEIKSTERIGIRHIVKGSNPGVTLEQFVQNSYSNQVVVGFGIGVQDNNVNKINIKLREIDSFGNLGPVVTKSSGSGPIEQEFEAPTGHIITGIRLGCKSSNINAFEIDYRDIELNVNSCLLEYGTSSTYDSGSNEFEVEFDLLDEQANYFQGIQGIGAEVYDSNIRALKVKIAEYEID